MTDSDKKPGMKAEETQADTPHETTLRDDPNDPGHDTEPEEPLKRYRFSVMQTVDLWGESTVDAYNEEEAEEEALENFKPDWTNSSTVDFTAELESVEDIPTRVPADRVSVELMPESDHPASTSPEAKICLLELGRFTSTISATAHEAGGCAHTAQVSCDGKALYDPLDMGKVSCLQDIVEDGGLKWLTDTLYLHDLSLPNSKDLDHFQEVTRATGALISRFTKLGHEEVLKQADLASELEVEVKATPEAKEDQAQTTERVR